MVMETIEIHDVWAHNLEEEFARIREIVVQYPFIAMVFIQFTCAQ
jgi:CCR4-NOT transcription complex subunit 7/8